MKSLRIFLIFVLLFTFSTIGCAFGQKQYDVKNFKGISVAIPANVNIYQSPEYKLEIVAPAKYVDDIKVEVEGDILRIKKVSKLWRNVDSDDFVVNVWSPVYNLVSVVGSCDVKAKTTITTDEIKLKISGSGDIEILDLESPKVEISSCGSGDVALKGGKVAETFKIGISGSGDIEAAGFCSKRVRLSISGSGDVEVGATESLEGDISGSGDLIVHGNALLDVKVSGSGTVRQVR